MTHDRRGQAAVETLATLPLLVSAVIFAALQFAQLALQHLSWLDLVTLHRARLYQNDTACVPHSFWPTFFRERIHLSCHLDSSILQSHFETLPAKELRLRGHYRS